MASERQLAANRNNAGKSTGPRSSAGKRRASQNARRHGFAAAAFRAGAPKQVDVLAHQIAGEANNPLILGKARRAAQATFDLAQIRRAKVELIASHAAEFTNTPSLRPVGVAQPSGSEASDHAVRKAIGDLLKFDRYEKRAVARRSQELRAIIALSKDQRCTLQNEPKIPEEIQ